MRMLSHLRTDYFSFGTVQALTGSYAQQFRGKTNYFFLLVVLVHVPYCNDSCSLQSNNISIYHVRCAVLTKCKIP